MRPVIVFRLLTFICWSGSAAVLLAEPRASKAKAANSDFSALLCGTIQYAHDDVWLHTPASTGPLVPTATEIVRGQRLDIVVSFGEFAVDAEGNGDVVYDLFITKPDGTDQLAGSNLKAFKGHVTNRRMVYTAVDGVTFSAPMESPAGRYRYTAKVQDRVGHAEVFVSNEVTVVEGTERALPADFDLKKMEEWLTHYYEHPDPLSALPVLRFVAHDPKLLANSGAWPPILGAYEMILRDNPWLVNAFKARVMAAGTDNTERNALLYVLAYAFRKDRNFGRFLPTDPHEAFVGLQNQDWDDPDRELLSGGQLDTLWGRFFATGAYAPVQRLGSALGYQKYHGSIAAFKQLNPRPKDPSPEVIREIVYGAAVWSLKANTPRHPLLGSYLTYLANDPKTPPEISLQIAFIIGAKVQTRDGQEFDPKNLPTPPH